MKIDGIDLTEGSEIDNLTVERGTSYPSLPDIGQMFFRTDAPNVGLKIFNGQIWLSLDDNSTGNSAFFENDQVINANYVIGAGRNAGSIGPITIGANVSVVISSGSNWNIF